MDPRRFLILAGLAIALSGCAVSRHGHIDAPISTAPTPVFDLSADTSVVSEGSTATASAPEAAPKVDEASDETVGVPYEAVGGSSTPASHRSAGSGRRALAEANLEAREGSDADAFIGGVQVFAWSPGRVYAVWSAPLRVTTLSLEPGETLVAKAAGDTVRWQIGEATSGEGATLRTHVLLKPLQRGLQTNLVLTTNRRVYFLDLHSGGPDGFNAAVAWNTADVTAPASPVVQSKSEVGGADPIVAPEGPLDGRYLIQPQGRRARWTPASVFNDGRRTFIAFNPDLQINESPALFIIAPDGEAQMVNYRQSGGVFIVDGVFERAELRLGDRRPQIVRIRRLAGASR